MIPFWRSVRRRPGRGEAETDAASATVLQLAVLLQAGVAPARAWEHLAGVGDPAAARVVAATAHETPLPAAIAAIGTDAWREVAVAYQVASTVGAPLAACLRGLATALTDAQEAADDVRVALAEPAGTARLMGWLPLLAVALGAALGFDTFGTLFGSPPGIACLAAGGALIVVAQRWTARLVRSADDGAGVPGFHAELVAIALSGGVSIERALAVVADADALRRPAAPTLALAPTAGPTVTAGSPDDVASVLSLSRSAGVPAVELLRASADHARHRARVDGRLRAAKLSSRLLVPLGVCTLPAFLLLGVAPMLLSVMSTMSLSL
ncbi:type II secretion system F family protein [Microbacterium sp. NEAU-LLC]|uniref:Type II secretion system F family protein n=1 Tax=Microbacterium helvum TaxID=2773713 RepID=A0ABR8NR09_9MICO|nr:type II secretion system F family protein [Microbacterium helvum]MBD3942872.1 type II secretion system F family protein [Microbacterium helvum]